jgi:hypothetical protein
MLFATTFAGEGDRRLLNPLWHQTLRSGLCRREILVQT